MEKFAVFKKACHTVKKDVCVTYFHKECKTTTVKECRHEVISQQKSNIPVCSNVFGKKDSLFFNEAGKRATKKNIFNLIYSANYSN